jgi:hypothetical protein
MGRAKSGRSSRNVQPDNLDQFRDGKVQIESRSGDYYSGCRCAQEMMLAIGFLPRIWARALPVIS